jgi:hypothetical protein
MITTDLQGIAEAVVRRAQRQGFVLPREVREELAGAGQAEELWKDVVALARPALKRRQGCYYYTAPVSARVRQEQSRQRTLQRAVRQLIRQYRAAARPQERRGEDRMDFIQPVQVRTEDGRAHTLLSRDLSATGIRLIGSRGFLGQKLHVLIPRPGEEASWDFLVHILWTCAVGDNLYENGGPFLEVAQEAGPASQRTCRGSSSK